MALKLELGEEAYRIVSDSDEGELTDYEDAATLASGGELYAAFLDSEDQARDGFSKGVYKLTALDTEFEAVEFDEGDAGEGDDEPGTDEAEHVGETETVNAE